MTFSSPIHAILARQSILVVSLIQYAVLFFFIGPDDFFVFGLMAIVSIYGKSTFEGVIQPSGIKYSVDSNGSALYSVHYLVISLIAYFTYSGDYTLLALLIAIGFLQLYCNKYFTSFSINAYLSEKYYRLAFSQASADFLSLVIGLIAFLMTLNVYWFALRFLLSPLFLLIFCHLFLDGSSINQTAERQSPKSKLYINMQQIMGFVGRTGDRLIIAALMEPLIFSLYDRAMSGMRFVFSAISQPLTPLALIKFVKVKEHGSRSVVVFLMKFSSVVYLFGWIVLVIIASLIPILSLVLPINWIGVTEILAQLIWLIPINMMIFNASSFFIAQGREDLNFLSGILSALTLIFGFSLGLLGGIDSAISCLVIAMIINVCQVYTLLLYHLGFGTYCRFYILPFFHFLLFTTISL